MPAVGLEGDPPISSVPVLDINTIAVVGVRSHSSGTGHRLLPLLARRPLFHKVIPWLDLFDIKVVQQPGAPA